MATALKSMICSEIFDFPAAHTDNTEARIQAANQLKKVSIVEDHPSYRARGRESAWKESRKEYPMTHQKWVGLTSSKILRFIVYGMGFATSRLIGYVYTYIYIIFKIFIYLFICIFFPLSLSINPHFRIVNQVNPTLLDA